MKISQKLQRTVFILCLLLTIFFAISPLERACFRQPLNYNEGWNIYNVVRISEHQQLYPANYSWTTNNYPMGSFVLMAALHRLTGDYLFTGRAVAQISTILLCFFIWIALKELGATQRAAWLGALFCFALFATNTAASVSFAEYTNADDPEMLGLMLFTGGLALYLISKRRPSWKMLVASALVFATAISFKHSAIAILAAVLIDSLWYPLKRLLIFLTALASGIGLSIYLQLHFGGPWFLHNLLEKRTFDPGRALTTFGALFLPGCVPLACALFYALWRHRTGPRRIILILIATTATLGFYFGSAEGVSINCFFPLMVALSIGLGAIFSDMESLAATPHRAGWHLVPLALFLTLFIPASLNNDIDPIAVWRSSKANQTILDSEVRFMAEQPGNALCENLLTCYLAGKPYLLDPFNTTRLIQLGHLDQTGLVDSIRQKQYSSIEIESFEMEMLRHKFDSERFTLATLQAIQQNYQPGYQNGVWLIYVPRR